MRPLHIIANPNSAGGRGRRVLPRLQRRLRQEGIEFTLVETRRPGHASELARAAVDAGETRILVVGGDGTIHEVTSGLLSRRAVPKTASQVPELAVLPVGTGNDFFRMVRAGWGLDGTVRVLREGVTRPFDVGTVKWSGGETSFVNLLGVGIDVEVLQSRVAFHRLPGLLQYLGALGSALLRHRSVPLAVTLRLEDGGSRTVEGPVLLCAITVGPSIGGGFLLAPDARRDDGLLDLFIAEELGFTKVIRYLPDVLRGTVARRPEVHQAQVLEAEIRRLDGRPFAFELDGELMGDETEFLMVRVDPGRLRILELPESPALTASA